MRLATAGGKYVAARARQNAAHKLEAFRELLLLLPTERESFNSFRGQCRRSQNCV
jgi:hypothetical protein